MKHFFEKSTDLDENGKAILLKKAKNELKKDPMKLEEMSSKMDLVCLNAGSANEYIPKGMESIISIKNLLLEQRKTKDFSRKLNEIVQSATGDILGYVLENIQVKDIKKYFHLIFDLKYNFTFTPFVIAHFSNEELINYLGDFLELSLEDSSGSNSQNSALKIEVFDDNSETPWKVIEHKDELSSVDRMIKEPIIMDRPFFSDILLNINQGGQEKVFNYPFGKLKTILGRFNRQRGPGGVIIRAKNKIFLKTSDINGVKLASLQPKTLLGISINGEYTAASEFITKNIGLNNISFDDVDFLKCKLGRQAVEIKVSEITSIEVGLDNQQVIFLRGTGKEDNHISRFKRLKLHKNKETAMIDRVIPFNRGESNYDLIQMYGATKYTEIEKAKKIKQFEEEFGLLKNRHLMAGDITSYLILSNLNQLGYIPFKVECIGFDAENVHNPERMNELLQEWFGELKFLIADILDTSKTPDFTEHNFNRLTRNLQKFKQMDTSDQVESSIFKKLLKELEELTQYMDDFFKLNLYKNRQKQADSTSDDDELESLEEIDEQTTSGMDEDSKRFISKNFEFFKKRDLVQSALLKIERMMFFYDHIKPYSQDVNFEPGMIVYRDEEALIKNYKMSAYPAYNVSKMFSSEILKSESEEDEFYFVKFMREFTAKVFEKSQKLKETFHHHYKNTLAEIVYLTDQKLAELKQEMAFLDDPKNKEEGYKKLLVKIKEMYYQHLDKKKENIEDLGKELIETEQKHEEYRILLEKETHEEIPPEKVQSVVDSMPERLEVLKQEVLKKHQQKEKVLEDVLLQYVIFHRVVKHYFKKVHESTEIFEKTQWFVQQKKMFQQVGKEVRPFFKMEESQLDAKIKALENVKFDKTKILAIEKQITELSVKQKKIYQLLLKNSTDYLFQDKNKKNEDLLEYLNYYRDESKRSFEVLEKLNLIYMNLSKLQNSIIMALGKIAAYKTQKNRNELLIKILQLIRKNPNCLEEIREMLKSVGALPKKDKQELKILRTDVQEAVVRFKKVLTEQAKKTTLDDSQIRNLAEHRFRLNDISKDLVNFIQGIDMIKEEIVGEEKDLEFLKSQESQLEQVAMSKALPSTRVLLKNQYIPLLEREKIMLNRADKFLTEVISKEKKLRQALSDTFFRKRYAYPQFLNGYYCIDNAQGTKNHTEKNIYSAYMLLADKFSKGIKDVPESSMDNKLEKLVVNGVEGIKNKIYDIWTGNTGKRVIFLPSSLKIDTVLNLCEYKRKLAKSNPMKNRSANSLILVYINQFSYLRITGKPELVAKYNDAILSNIFINVDGTEIYNNRESIYDACIQSTFAKSNEKVSRMVAKRFLTEV